MSDLMGQGQGPSNESLTLHLPSGRPGQTPPPRRTEVWTQGALDTGAFS